MQEPKPLARNRFGTAYTNEVILSMPVLCNWAGTAKSKYHPAGKLAFKLGVSCGAEDRCSLVHQALAIAC
jgi:hypothetical protein